MSKPSMLQQNEMQARPNSEWGPPEAGPKRRMWWLWLVVLAVLGYGAYRFRQNAVKDPASGAGLAARSAARSVPVVVLAARTGDMPVYLRGLGTATAFNTVTVKSRVDGQLVKVAFREGQLVHQGDLLAEIDRRPFEVQLTQAQGQMARDQAQLSDAKANLSRGQNLYAEGIVAKQQLDSLSALVGQYEGTIQSDQAQIDNARLNLTYSRITAPISGRVGLRLVDEGNIVHANDPNGLVVIAQLQPIAVLFNIPEDNLSPVLKKLRTGSRLPVEAYDRDDRTKLAVGSLLTVDNQIDQSTGTLRLKAVFDNTDNALFPNQFVNVHMLLDLKKAAVIVPAVAIQRGPQGTFVYVVKGEQTAEARPVVLGTAEGNDVSIEKGLSAEELVVVDGMDKLQDGSKVETRTPGNATGRRRSP